MNTQAKSFEMLLEHLIISNKFPILEIFYFRMLTCFTPGRFLRSVAVKRGQLLTVIQKTCQNRASSDSTHKQPTPILSQDTSWEWVGHSLRICICSLAYLINHA